MEIEIPYDPSDEDYEQSELNGVVLDALRSEHMGCDSADWINDPVTVIWELADHGDLTWVPEIGRKKG
ncbi:hypothetical protein [Streptomyces sp. NPDC053048]|uniref:hypothetical protein n=1 Tax=Streptomyces sp. NPDC053048 TaxID=3365694 RepID=UPI0037D6813E